MCGRFVLTADPETIRQTFDLETVPAELPPRYNVAPSQPIAVVSNDNPRALDFYRWGLIPSWAKDPGIGNKMINARSETAHEKPAFRSAFKRRRCLVPANGFYEWPQKTKQPVYIHLKDEELFAFAGLWETWQSPEGEAIRTCTILTSDPNELVSNFHHRMAVILRKEDYQTWLSPDDLSVDEMRAMLQPYDAAFMNAYEVSKIVNSPANDTPECIVPLVPPQQQPLL